MPRDLDALTGWIEADEWPLLPCPRCGRLTLKPTDVTNAVSAESRLNRRHEDWQPDWITGTFGALFECSDSSCAERVSIAGDFIVDAVGQTSFDDPPFADHYRVRFALPALPILKVPRGTPDLVKDSIRAAAEDIWLDPNAAANRLRVAVELLLSAHRVPMTSVDKNGRRVRRSLHSRIVTFKKTHQVSGDALEAVKWIGNSGSHPGGVSAAEVLESAEMLEYALRDLYDKTDAEVRRRIKAVNKAKGLPRKRAVQKR